MKDRYSTFKLQILGNFDYFSLQIQCAIFLSEVSDMKMQRIKKYNLLSTGITNSPWNSYYHCLDISTGNFI